MSVTWKPLEEKYRKLYNNVLKYEDMVIEYNPGKYLSTCFYKDVAQRILDAPVREDDVWVISYPRTGSTWCQEMVWLIGNNLDFETARNTLQFFRAPLPEGSSVLFEFIDTLKERYTDSLDYINNLPSPRFIKSHISYDLLPTELHKVKPKIIYLLRNPKDVCVSYYFHCKILHNFNVDFETFCELFLENAVGCGGVIDHYLPFWKRRDESHILIVRYEEMVEDTRGTLKKISEFMGKHLSEDDIKAIMNFLSVQSMRKNPACNMAPLLDAKNGENFYERTGTHFIRNGKVGDWKNHMSKEMAAKFDEYIEKNTKGTDLRFD